ncbi:SGNH/GDSL hydrolase family protein [Jatrophihabitans sp.]|uniref:SGNH/GDSL hydrolase family protein n=1 Tax=Jatrophihabitans sp. TaxID=1932789 RepID=UPI002EEE9C46
MPEPTGGETVSAGETLSPGETLNPGETAACEILLLTDSLAFHGPGMGELTTEPKLWPNVLAAALSTPGRPCRATIFGRRGWTARDAWFALTRDPYVYSVLLPRADIVVLAVGGMDYLPTILPSHLREGIRLLRPRPLRTAATALFRRAQPLGSVLLGGRWRTLPQPLTNHYLSRCVAGIHYFHPHIQVLGVVPPPHDAPGYGRVRAGHQPAIRAALDWGRQAGVDLLRLDEWVRPYLGTPGMNVDGIHWGWDCHRAVGEQAAARLRAIGPAKAGGPAG